MGGEGKEEESRNEELDVRGRDVVIQDKDGGTVVCRQYGLLHDSGRDDLVSICGGDKRINTFYRSTGTRLKIWVTTSGDLDTFSTAAETEIMRFIIRYQG